ncbi:T9SS type A sorting domain-containing protein [uncultured Pontibacter sp.]|uniref:T9SS type A sorting domain-containing protein n=1 Tax=uncultured Pontibacter sp. TaxID=453356 RepID=UPI0026165218|nr:T9SS type A sorting domain-containing protein [uncultured Pontibacter sp.]
MKTYLRLFTITLIAFLGAIGNALAQGPTISSTLGGAEDVKLNEAVAFTVTTTRGNAAEGTMVKGRMVLLGDNIPFQSENIKLEYLEAGSDPQVWLPLPVSSEGVAAFGPEDGFPLADAISSFRITFSAVGTYNYTLELRNASTNAIVASATEAVSVTFKEPTINTTLDNISQQDVIATGAEVLFRVFLEAEDREGQVATTRLVLNNPADRTKFTLQYATNVELGTDFETLTVGEDGILVFGPEEGFPLADTDRLFKITFSEAGTYEYAVQVLIGGDVVGFSNETVTVVEGGASIASTLNDATLELNTAAQFTVSVNRGAWGEDNLYRVRVTLDDPEQAETFALATADGTPLAFDANGVAYYGDAAGFTLAENVTENFVATATDYGTYNYRLELLRLVPDQDPQVIASSEESAVVPFESATVATTLNGKQVERDVATTFTVTVTPNDQDPTTMVQGRLTLANPEQAANVALEYQDEAGAYQPINFSNGVALIGPAAGMALSDVNGLNFRVSFNAAGTYAYTLDLVEVDGDVIATVNESVEALTPTSIKKGFEKGGFAVYPTLTTGAVKVDLVNARNANIQVVDLIGRTVAAQDNANGVVELDLSRVAKGTYIIKIQDGSNINTQRVVVR